MRKLWERDIGGREFSFCRGRRASIAIEEIFLGGCRLQRERERAVCLESRRCAAVSLIVLILNSNLRCL